MSDLTDVFAPSTATRPTTAVEGAATDTRTDRRDTATIEANYQQLNDRRAATTRATIARRDAATARQVAQAFSEYGRAFRKVADTKGSPVDHAVCIDLADYCERRVAEYAALQAHCSTVADRAGSI
jgi:hypothetical protein